MERMNLSIKNGRGVLSTPYKNCYFNMAFNGKGIVKVKFNYKKGEYKTNDHGQAVITSLLKKLNISLNVDMVHTISFKLFERGLLETFSFKKLMPQNNAFITLKKRGSFDFDSIFNS